jgi:predicted Zn-dependent protease
MGNSILGTIADLAIAITLGVNTQGLMGALAGRAFSKEFETEADYVGLYLVARAGKDYRQAAPFWRRMAAEHPDSIQDSFLATHPSAPERFISLEHTAKEIVAKASSGKKLLPEK